MLVPILSTLGENLKGTVTIPTTAISNPSVALQLLTFGALGGRLWESQRTAVIGPRAGKKSTSSAFAFRSGLALVDRQVVVMYREAEQGH